MYLGYWLWIWEFYFKRYFEKGTLFMYIKPDNLFHEHDSARLKEEQILAEEKAERRMEMYMNSVKKSRKRPRIFEEMGNDESATVKLLKSEQEKVQVILSF